MVRKDDLGERTMDGIVWLVGKIGMAEKKMKR